MVHINFYDKLILIIIYYRINKFSHLMCVQCVICVTIITVIIIAILFDVKFKTIKFNNLIFLILYANHKNIHGHCLIIEFTIFI